MRRIACLLTIFTATAAAFQSRSASTGRIGRSSHNVVVYAGMVSETVRSRSSTDTIRSTPTPKDGKQNRLAEVQKVVLLPPRNGLAADVSAVMTTAALVCGNTVGAGALVLPELVAKPGFAISTGMFVSAYIINVISGLILAEVAIKQHEAHAGEEEPSSLRKLAEISLESKNLANGVGGLSLFVNTCALTFSLGRAGEIFTDMTGGTVDHFALSVAFAGALALLGATQSRVRISQVSSVLLTALFVSVAGLIGPGLGAVDDVVGTLLAPGTSPDVFTGVLEAAPIMLTTLIFQNIVPPVTRILGYDRRKSVAALLIGSFLPLALYVTWSYVVLGGGVDTNVGIDSPLMTVFSVAALTGSSIGCTMAISEELQAFVDSGKDDPQAPPIPDATKDLEVNKDTGYALPAVLTAILVPLACTTICHEYTDALKISGGYGIPVLYGAIPVAMAWTQRNKLRGHADLIPGGTASLGLVVAAFGAFILNSVLGDLYSITGSL